MPPLISSGGNLGNSSVRKKVWLTEGIQLLCQDLNDPEKQNNCQLELLQTHELIRNPLEYQIYADLLRQSDDFKQDR